MARRRNPEVWVGQHRQHGRRHVDLDDLTEAQIEKLPRDAFTQDEFDSLAEEMQEYILDKDEDSQARIEALVKVFVEPYKWLEDPSEEYVFDMVDDDYFGSWLREKADHLVAVAEDRGHGAKVESIVEAHTEEGYTTEQIHAAIDEAMQDTSNYDKLTSDEYSSAFFKDGRSEDSLSIDSTDIKKALTGMFPEEIERAAKEIDDETDRVYRDRFQAKRNKFSANDIQEHAHAGYVEVTVSVSMYVDWEPDWDKIGTAVEGILEGLEPEAPESDEARAEREAREALSLDERKVMVFPDGFYWLELIPSELEAEGARNDKGLSHCIGDAGEDGHGYPEALQKGWARAFSLRAPSGKRKLTLWADLTHSSKHVGKPTIRGVSQVKGKSNRLPGWDLHQAGQGRMKEDEVKKTIIFLANYLDFEPSEVPDLRPALKHLAKHDPEFFDEYVSTGPGDRAEALAGNPAPRRAGKKHSCSTCGGEAVGFCAPYRAP